ncbi:hypothetical protein PG989_000270 [Apiospora arundinis]
MPQRRRRQPYNYQYQLLPPDSFRQLELLPAATLYADINCRLWNHPMESAPSYEALSYTWGDGEKEKGVQVPLMRKIYTGAQRVIVWLGEESFDSRTAVEFIPVLTRVAQVADQALWLQLLSQEDFLRRMSSLICLFYRQWWTRTWTIQEVSLAREVIVLCGSCQIDWSIIHSFVMAWMDIEFEPPLSERTHLQTTALRTLGMLISGFSEALFRLRQELQTNTSAGKTMTLSNLLWSFKSRSVTDPRDKVYGLLGLLDHHQVQVDYSRPAEDIYVSVFRSFLSEDGGLDWFRWMTGELRRPGKLDLPSWVPDFNERKTRPISSFLPYPDSKRLFSADGPVRSLSTSILRFEDGHRTLVLQGHSFDIVSERGLCFPLPDEVMLSRQPTEPIYSHWKDMALNTLRGPYLSRVAKEEAYWRTLLTDREIGGFHFKDRAGWILPRRLSSSAKCIPPRNVHEEYQLLQALESRAGLCVSGRRFCVTSNGYFGLMPATVSDGDLVCVLLGGEVPYVLRPTTGSQAEQYYELVGECYIHGIMDGKVEANFWGNQDTYDVFRLR